MKLMNKRTAVMMMVAGVSLTVVGVAVGPSDEAVTDTPVEAVTDTPVEAVTDTPVEAVTDTPVEAVTDTPVEAVTDTPVDGDGEYAAYMVENLDTLGRISGLADDFGVAINDSDLVEASEVAGDLGTEYYMLWIGSPGDTGPLGAASDAAYLQCATAYDDSSVAITLLNVDMIEAATAEIRTCTDLLSVATSAVNDYNSR